MNPLNLKKKPLSGAERAKKYIEKLKAQGKFEDFKSKHALVAKKSRLNVKNTLQSLPPRVIVKEVDEIRENTISRVRKHRENRKSMSGNLSKDNTNKSKETYLKTSEKVRKQIKIRVRKHRQMKKVSQNSDQSSSVGYTTKLAARKAISRGEKGLPKSLEKRKFVVKKMYEKYFDLPKVATAPVPRSTGLNFDVKEAVKSFYERSDISQQAPGRKDYVIIKDELGNKTKVQKKYLMFPIREVYDKFCKETGTVPLSRSKFFSLRPKHVISSSKTPHNICLCIYHANFNYAIDALKKNIPDMPRMHGEDFYATFFCEPITKDCYVGTCKSCKDVFSDTILGVVSSNKDLQVKWQAWVKVSNRWQEKEQSGSLDKLAHYIVDISSHFFKHHYINEEQLKSYRRCVSDVKSNESAAVIQIDFAENYKCVFQNEAGNAHWNQSQVSIFTAAIWTSGGMNSYSVVTDDSDHSKRTIVPYVDRLFEELPNGIKTVHIWSDGPTSQFKNKFIAAALLVLERKHKMKLYWNFFAASHGKGPTDGTGGALKLQVWTAVKTRRNIVCDASDFSEAVNEQSKVKVLLMDTATIDKRNASMNMDFEYENAKDVRGIFEYHHLQIVDQKVVGFITTQEGFDC